MPKYIDADNLKTILEERRDTATRLYGNLGGAMSGCIKLLDHQPAADVVPVVRCENCQFFGIVEYWPDGTKKVCQLLKRQVLENSFCCWGMKKETNDENAEV